MASRWAASAWVTVLVLVSCGGLVPAAEPQVVNWSVLDKVVPGKFAPPEAPLGPVKLVGARNGVYAGQVVVVHTEAIKGLKVAATDLKGPGVIPASAVAVRYGVLDGVSPVRGEPGAFDSLADTPPVQAEVMPAAGKAIQPLWISVGIPAGAAPGAYTGAVTLTMDGARPVQVPLQVAVAAWTLPKASEFAAHLDIIQSPESVALAYEVEPWREAHLKLLDRTFALLAPLAAKTLYLTAVRRTHFGNEQAMVRWVADENGDLKPNLDLVDRYLTVAVRHLGKVPGVVLYSWEPTGSMGHAGGTGTAGRTTDRTAALTFYDPETGAEQKRNGPAWGTPESKALWKSLTDNLKPVLAKHGLEDSLLFGLIGDARPTKVAMDDIANGVSEPRWAVHSHFYCDQWQGYKVGMCSALWGIHLNVVDPKDGRGYGWQNPFWLAYYPREMSLLSPLAEYRFKLEMWMGAFSKFEMDHYGKSRTARGLGRLGADFWPVLKDARGRPASTLAGRYPESYWGQLNLNYCVPSLLGRGAAGPIPTVRSEALRESAQDVETRVFIEKAILNEANKAKLGEAFIARCRAALDERIRLANDAGGARQDQVSGIRFRPPTIPADWPDRQRALYDLAADVAAKLGAP